ncbi:hypothetical protein D3C71_1250720 [compost metagenome]
MAHDARQGVGLVVAQIDVHRQQPTGIVVEPTGCAGRHGVEHVLVGQELVPPWVAFVKARQHPAVEQRERVGALDAVDLAQLPFERIDLVQRIEVGALALGRLDHHRQHVTACAIGCVHEAHIAVVAAVCAQLGRPGVQVADLELRADKKTSHPHDQPGGHGHRGPRPLGEAVEQSPQRVFG